MKKQNNSWRNFAIFLIACLIYMTVPGAKEFIKALFSSSVTWAVIFGAMYFYTRLRLFWSQTICEEERRERIDLFSDAMRWEQKFYKFQRRCNKFKERLRRAYVTIKEQGEIIRQGRKDVAQLISNNDDLRLEAMQLRERAAIAEAHVECFNSFLKVLDEMAKEEFSRDVERHYRTEENKLLNTISLHRHKEEKKAAKKEATVLSLACENEDLRKLIADILHDLNRDLILIEAGEEIESRHLRQFIEKLKQRLEKIKYLNS